MITISISWLAIFLTVVYILGVLTTPLLIYVFVTNPARIYAITQKKGNVE